MKKKIMSQTIAFFNIFFLRNTLCDRFKIYLLRSSDNFVLSNSTREIDDIEIVSYKFEFFVFIIIYEKSFRIFFFHITV